MLRNYFFIFLSLHCVFGEKSFTMVVDTTGSMEDEINIFKLNLGSIMKAMTSGSFYNFILIPFLHLNPGPPLISQSPEGLIDIVNAIEVSKRYEDCHENSLDAIKKALEVSNPKSLIFVFTDAEAQDSEKLYSIQSLCDKRQSQVVIFQSGTCLPAVHGSVDPWLTNENIYKKIVTSCGGSYFFFYLNELEMAFKYMQEIAKVEWNIVNSHKEFYGQQEYAMSIDHYTRDVLVAISGINPQIEIKDNFGERVMIDEIIATSYIKVIRISKVAFGEYTAEVSCQGSTLITVYRKKEVKFKHGFSTLQPNSLKETTLLPIPGILNYLLISLPNSDLQLISIGLKVSDEKDPRIVDHRVINEYKNFYAATILIEPEKTFQVLVNCRDRDNKEISGASNQMEPQPLVSASQTIPQAEILETDPFIDFGQGYSLACKVISYPKPDIWWENSMQERMHSESALLEIPNVYISYVKIENVTKNETITCKCKNYEGEDAINVNIYVNRSFTFEVIQFPSDTTIEYGSEGRLFCEVNAYPEAEIKWYYNDTLIEESETIEIVADEHMLLINKMSLDHAGTYECKISNTIEDQTFSAEISISGLENPQVDLQNSEILLKPGDQMEQQCSIIKGKPFPEVSWKYKSTYDNDLSDLPDGVTIDGTTLKIESANLSHGGFYVCRAVSNIGKDEKQVSVKIQYPPKIKNEDENRIVNFGDLVELKCDVDAVPEVNVRWDMYVNDVIVPFDGHHSTDYSNTHRFRANKNDSGKYVCLAQNEVGTATRTVNINVYVAPYIKPLAWTAITAKRGSTIVLDCTVVSGNPIPSSRWVFIEPNLLTTELLRRPSAVNLELVLKNITRKHEGSYQCISENKVASDSVRVSLKVLN